MKVTNYSSGKRLEFISIEPPVISWLGDNEKYTIISMNEGYSSMVDLDIKSRYGTATSIPGRISNKHKKILKIPKYSIKALSNANKAKGV